MIRGKERIAVAKAGASVASDAADGSYRLANMYHLFYARSIVILLYIHTNQFVVVNVVVGSRRPGLRL